MPYNIEWMHHLSYPRLELSFRRVYFKDLVVCEYILVQVVLLEIIYSCFICIIIDDSILKGRGYVFAVLNLTLYNIEKL